MVPPFVISTAMPGRFVAEVTGELSNPASGSLKLIRSKKDQHADQTRQGRAALLLHDQKWAERASVYGA